MAASILREENPDHFSLLTQQWINYRFSDKSADLQSRVAMIEVNDLREIKTGSKQASI